MEPILHSTGVERFPEEELRLLAWRREQLRSLGVSRRNAYAYAETVDWHDVALLVQRGCPPDTALEIVR
ncbi:MAG TPA: hypothetical protein VHH55_06195 [Gaiellaceae bacterium]|jgi:hypothetical protein|nr:hypothetical protein [Gaiellaceae bacterium]